MANPNPNPATRFRQGRSGNPGGKVRDPLTRELREALTPEDRKKIIDTVISFAKAGKVEYVHMIWDRIEGKVVARQEAGDPGAFSDLAHVPSEELMRRLQEVRKLK